MKVLSYYLIIKRTKKMYWYKKVVANSNVLLKHYNFCKMFTYKIMFNEERYLYCDSIICLLNEWLRNQLIVVKLWSLWYYLEHRIESLHNKLFIYIEMTFSCLSVKLITLLKIIKIFKYLLNVCNNLFWKKYCLDN